MIFFLLLNLLSLAILISLLLHYRIGGVLFSSFLIVVLIIAEERMNIFSWLGGNFHSPNFPNWLVIALSWLSGWFLLSALTASVVLIFIHLPLIRNYLGAKGKILFVFSLIFSLVITTWSGINAQINPEVIKFDIDSGINLEKPYRIVQLTDTHISSLTRVDFFNSMVDSVNKLNADLIVITGDIADGSVINRSPLADRLSELKAKDGILIVLGNHEYYYEYQEWKEYYKGLSFTLLENDCTVIKHGNVLFRIVGVADERALKGYQDNPNLQKAMKRCPDSDKISYSILLKHRPKYANKYLKNEYKFDLMLSGHTHGGMVPFLGAIAAMKNSGFLRGWYKVGDAKLFVSDGTHLWNGFPFRIGTKNSIVAFDIK